jgi:S1-C subfamily serine protease
MGSRMSGASAGASGRARRRSAGRLVVPVTLALLLAGCAGGGATAPTESAAVPPAATPPEATGPLDAEQIARTFGDAVWQVEVDGCDLESGGSSFAIGPDLLITNRHVVEFDPNPTLTSRDGSVVLPARVIGMSDEVDLAVLAVDARLDLHLEWAPTAMLAEGQRVVSLGYPSPFETFAVAVGTLNAFDVVDGVRVGIISDEASDYGSSGGPLLTDRGLVAGIVTEFAGEGGRQVLGVSLTYDAVRAEIDRIVASPQELVEDCVGAEYGTDAVLDLLWDWCDADAMWACDELYGRAASGSDYEDFGASCGDRVDTDEWCTVLFDAPEAFTRGDVPELDELWEGCVSGRGDWALVCDTLFQVAPLDSEYEAFGDTCGGRNEPSGWCEDLYP